jgi:endonuclease/exonuclease/phosphatase family metal-dependent hydrolase
LARLAQQWPEKAERSFPSAGPAISFSIRIGVAPWQGGLMSTVRIATFNCENLFRRFKFKKNVDPEKAGTEGFVPNDLAFEILNAAEKKLTALAIKETGADVIALQEVESLEVLRRFRSDYLKSAGYTFAMLIEGNDPRAIDVAVLSKYPLFARSYCHLRSGSQPLFSRDCLEVDLDVAGKPLTLYVNHLKSMLDKKDPKNGRKNTRNRRIVQSKMVKQIITDRFGTGNIAKAPFVVLGDFNDYLGPGTGIDELVEWTAVENVVDRLPLAERWTHFWGAASEPLEGYKQIDYILPSKSLAAASGGQPTLIRKGLCTKADRYTGPRFPGVTNKNEASDHCPLVFDIEL